MPPYLVRAVSGDATPPPPASLVTYNQESSYGSEQLRVLCKAKQTT